MSPAASLWELEIPKKVLMFFEGSIFRLCAREMPKKVLMGKVLAVDPYTLGGGSNKGALHSISYIEKYGLTFLHSRKPYGRTPLKNLPAAGDIL